MIRTRVSLIFCEKQRGRGTLIRIMAQEEEANPFPSATIAGLLLLFLPIKETEDPIMELGHLVQFDSIRTLMSFAPPPTIFTCFEKE